MREQAEPLAQARRIIVSARRRSLSPLRLSPPWRGAEPRAVPVLEGDARAKVRVQMRDVLGMKRQPVLVLLRRRAEDTKP